MAPSSSAREMTEDSLNLFLIGEQVWFGSTFSMISRNLAFNCPSRPENMQVVLRTSSMCHVTLYCFLESLYKPSIQAVSGRMVWCGSDVFSSIQLQEFLKLVLDELSSIICVYLLWQPVPGEYCSQHRNSLFRCGCFHRDNFRPFRTAIKKMESLNGRAKSTCTRCHGVDGHSQGCKGANGGEF